MIQIEGQLNASIKINGQDLPFAQAQGVSILITVNSKQALPALKLNIEDTGNLFSNNQFAINDGTRIDVVINNSRDERTSTGQFVSIGTPERIPSTINPGSRTYNIIGMHNKTLYVRGNPRAVYTGNSHEVIKELATACNMQFTTNFSGNDKMTWMPMRRNFASFISSIAAHSWEDDSSCGRVVVQENGALYFANITKLLSGTNVVAHISQSGNKNANNKQEGVFIQCLEHKLISSSGLQNHHQGYSSQSTRFSLTGIVENREAVAATKNSAHLDINRGISQELQHRGRIFMEPHDTGNSHRRYTEATHQNKKIYATYGQNVLVFIAGVSNLNLYDLVQFTAAEKDGSADETVSGRYLVTAYSRAIVNGYYREKIQLTNCGPNNENQGLF